MYAAKIEGHTRCLVAPKEMTEEQCHALHIRDELYADGIRMMASAWTPTPAELQLLQQGGHVILRVCSVGHPPVSLHVEPAPPL